MKPSHPKPGRPALGKAKRMRLSLTLKPELARQLRLRAARAGLSDSRLMEQCLEQALLAEDRERDLWQARLGVDQDQVAALCRALGVRRLSLFGSVLTDRFGPDSDVDLLAEFAPGAVRTLLDRGHAQMEFEALFGRGVDLTEARLIGNPIRLHEITSHCREIYASA